MKPSLSWSQQAQLLADRGLAISDLHEVETFLKVAGYYRFSGYGRYFQIAPHEGNDHFAAGAAFTDIRAIHDHDARLRNILSGALGAAEIALRAHTAHAISENHRPYRRYLEEGFYADPPSYESVVKSVRRDIARSQEHHILRYGKGVTDPERSNLPVWSAVEAWSFGTLSKTIERGAQGALSDEVALSLGVAKTGFASRVRSLVYLRNRCAHHGRLWNHSVLDAGPTPNNVRVKAKRLAGQFEPRSVLDVIASLDDIIVRGAIGAPVLTALVREHGQQSAFLHGLARPRTPTDRTSFS